MALRRRQAFRDNPELQQFVIPEARPTGRQLGVGSYGSVEELQVKGLVCAGKRMHEALLERDNEGVSNMERKYLEECQVMAKMRHPHIVQFLGLCYLEGSMLPVLVMERLDSSLDELLEGAPGLPLSLKRSLLADVVCGLLYLHTQHPPIVHRDLTSKNVLLTSSLVAKISDLGNARIMQGQVARITHMPGCMVYMPPEAFTEGCLYSLPLDIFSYGHLALFTLTQVFPGPLLPSTYVDPQNPNRTLGRSELGRRRDYIQQLNGMLGEEHPLVQLVCQCLHNSPDQRPTADELLQQLEAAKAQVEGPYGQIVKVDLERVRVLREKDTQIRGLQQQVQQVEAELEANRTQLQQKDGQLQQQGTELRERATQISRQQRELQTLREDKERLQAEVEAKNTQLQQKDYQLQQQGTELRERATQINRQQRELQTLREDKRRLQQQTQEKDVKISRHQRELQTVMEDKERLQTQVEAKTIELQTLMKDEGRLQQQEEMDVEISGQQRELQILRPVTVVEGNVHVPDYQTQNQELHAVLQQRLKKGDTWFLLDVNWMKQWKKYVGYDQGDQYYAGHQSANPGPIVNANLLKDQNSDALRDHCMEELDYSLVPEAAWNKLVAWYGLSQGSRPIARKVVEHGLYRKHLKVEVYLLEFKLYLHPKTNETVVKSFSRASSVASLKEEMKYIFGVSEDIDCRVWHRYMSSTYELLSDLSVTLQDAGLYDGQTIVLEQKNKDRNWSITAERTS